MRLVVYQYLSGKTFSFTDVDNDGSTRHVSEVEAKDGYSIGEEWYEEGAP